MADRFELVSFFLWDHSDIDVYLADLARGGILLQAYAGPVFRSHAINWGIEVSRY